MKPERLAELKKLVETIDLDCGDNSCLFAKNKGGMRTNGGCRCFDEARRAEGSVQLVARSMKAVPELIAEVERLRAIEPDHVAICEALGYLNQAEGSGYQVAPRETIVGTIEAMKSNEVRILEMQQGAHRWLSHGLPTGDFAGYVALALGKDEGDVSERLKLDGGSK